MYVRGVARAFSFSFSLLIIFQTVYFIALQTINVHIFTFTGATNVGSVQVYSDEELKTNKWCGLTLGKSLKDKDYDQREMPENLVMEKGQLVGQFNMGSTIVLIFEAPKTFK